MNKIKTQKGITLVALIITIVVLLILAVVAITAITDTDLIGKVGEATTKYNDSVDSETEQLGNYSNFLGGYLTGGDTVGDDTTDGGTTPEPSTMISFTIAPDITNTVAEGTTWVEWIGTGKTLTSAMAGNVVLTVDNGNVKVNESMVLYIPGGLAEVNATDPISACTGVEGDFYGWA